MTIRCKSLSVIPSVLLVLGLFAAAQPSLAASPCKGMAQDSCAADAQCAWVDSYTRKDGRAVAAHCKLKPRKAGLEQASLDLGDGVRPLSPAR